MSAQRGRRGTFATPIRRTQQMERVRRAAEAAQDRQQMAAVVAALPADDEDEAAELADGMPENILANQPEEQVAPPMDPNLAVVNAIAQRLDAYGREPRLPGIALLLMQTRMELLLGTLFGAGQIDKQEFEAAQWADMAGKLRAVLQSVEEQRLAEHEARQAMMGQPQPVRRPGIIVPGRQ